jgi:hypothetical protein
MSERSTTASVERPARKFIGTVVTAWDRAARSETRRCNPQGSRSPLIARSVGKRGPAATRMRYRGAPVDVTRPSPDMSTECRPATRPPSAGLPHVPRHVHRVQACHTCPDTSTECRPVTRAPTRLPSAGLSHVPRHVYRVQACHTNSRSWHRFLWRPRGRSRFAAAREEPVAEDGELVQAHELKGREVPAPRQKVGTTDGGDPAQSCSLKAPEAGSHGPEGLVRDGDRRRG